jgi:hypothetical protein
LKNIFKEFKKDYQDELTGKKPSINIFWW